MPVSDISDDELLWRAVRDAAALVRLIEGWRLPLSHEKRLQEALADEFTALGIAFKREVRLGAGDVVDFMLGDVAIEMKIKGARREIFRQVKRYCKHESVGALVLVTRVCMWLPATVERKPCFVASLGRAWL